MNRNSKCFWPKIISNSFKCLYIMSSPLRDDGDFVNALYKSLQSYLWILIPPQRVQSTQPCTWSRRVPTGCRVLVKRCNPKIMSDYGTLSLTSRDSAVTPLPEKEPLPMPPAIFGFIDALDTSLPQEKGKHRVNTRTQKDVDVREAEFGLFLLFQGGRGSSNRPHEQLSCASILIFSRGNKNADTMIQKVQKETTTKEWKSAICLRNYHLICIIGGLGCSSVPGGCVFIARLFAVINFSSAPDFLKGGRGRLLLNNEWQAFILSLKCPWCYNMKRQR